MNLERAVWLDHEYLRLQSHVTLLVIAALLALLIG